MTMTLGGTSFVTTQPAPIITLSPIFISPIIHTFAPTTTLSPIVGIRSFLPSFLLPIVVFCLKEKFSPIDFAFKKVPIG